MPNAIESSNKKEVQLKRIMQNGLTNCKIRRAVKIPMRKGSGVFHSFEGLMDDREHFAIGFADWETQALPLVRLHSECITGDLFGSARCDCGDQLREALSILQSGGGILLYMRQEGRGIGLYNKLDAYDLQRLGLDTFEANNKLNFPDDIRNYFDAAQMLKALGIHRIRLLSNNPEKRRQLIQCGITVEQTLCTKTYLKAENKSYLEAKKIKYHHTFHWDNKEENHDPTPLTNQWCINF